MGKVLGHLAEDHVTAVEVQNRATAECLGAVGAFDTKGGVRQTRLQTTVIRH